MKWASIVFLMFCSVAKAENESPLMTVRLGYSTTNVTTGSWVQLVSSLPNFVRKVQVFDSSGQVMRLGLGATTSAVAMPWVIMPGGQSDMIPMMAAAGQSLDIEAVSGTANAGEIDLNLYY